MNNFVSIKGLVGQAPKQIENEKTKFTVISVAQNYQTKDGTKKTSWFDATAFGSYSDKVIFLQKGDLVHIQGYLQTQKKEIAGQTYIFNRIVIQNVQKIAKLETPSYSDIPAFHEADGAPF